MAKKESFLKGFVSRIRNFCFKGGPVDKESLAADKDSSDRVKSSVESGGKKYQCQLCGRMIHEEHSLEHIKAEEYLINLIRKDHAHWQHKQPTCQECVEYYRKLITETEV